MIEIVFSDSACGGLKLAQRAGIGEYTGWSGYITTNDSTEEEIEAEISAAEKRLRLAWESAIPVGGTAADVYGFHLVLSVGDISENTPGNKRKQVIERLYGIFPYSIGSHVAEGIFTRIDTDLGEVRKRLSAGEDIRIWYSNQPDEMCGLFWFLWQLKQWDVESGQVFIVKLPDWETDEKGGFLQKISFGEVLAEEWGRYLELQKPVPPAIMLYHADHWQTLQRENAPLRAVLNGRLVSVPVTIYDDIIHREIKEVSETFQEVLIIGQVLGEHQLGISDAWIAFRIDEMVQAGLFEVVSEGAEDMPNYHRMLRKRRPLDID